MTMKASIISLKFASTPLNVQTYQRNKIHHWKISLSFQFHIKQWISFCEGIPAGMHREKKMVRIKMKYENWRQNEKFLNCSTFESNNLKCVIFTSANKKYYKSILFTWAFTLLCMLFSMEIYSVEVSPFGSNTSNRKKTFSGLFILGE